MHERVNVMIKGVLASYCVGRMVNKTEGTGRNQP